ncbi:class I SAM-dependent methyltransferase [Heyndrickxia acidicola]|uniref:Methyltransferase domain-containing protein n=1 Tax=Heyndrickxia acidicola TaxID=209389 RepID=A0ABU6MH67_9BACI|nr:methyltransferase domain-containing protein [Heyndrickxia acidicola]MED1204023.1 methyltransferase domain-containing protein [Heyndrickxia acidicola]
MSIKKDVQDQFGKNAESYVSSLIHKKGKDLAKMIEIANLQGNERAVDIATGGGHTANAFAPFVQKVTAVDLTSEMLTAAEKFIKQNGNLNVDFLQGDAENLPLEKESFEIVTCRIAPHHFPHVDKFVSEVYRILVFGGQFLLDDNVAPERKEFDEFYNTVEKIRDYSHFRAWKKTEWIQMLEQEGFVIEETYRFEKTFMFQEWCDRMRLQESVKAELNEIMAKAADPIKKKFSIQIENGDVKSFKGEAVLLKAIKS